jgi:hypothetical protein
MMDSNSKDKYSSYVVLFQKMALTAAEKQRRYRERRDNDLDRRREYLQKEKAVYVRKKEGQILPIVSLSSRNQRLQRKKWRLQKQEHRARKKETDEGNESMKSTSRQAIAGQKRRVCERRKRTKEYVNLRDELLAEKRNSDKYKKRWLRLQNKLFAGNTLEDTPRTKARKLLKDSPSVSAKVRKTLNFHHTVIAQIRSRYKDTSTQRSRQFLARCVTGKILKKYRFNNTLKSALGMSANRVYNTSNKAQCSTLYIRKPSISCSSCMQETIKMFYICEDNSRMTTCAKQTVTKGKMKKQKQLLNDTMKNLHLKYVAKNVSEKVSYPVFCRLRPFGVKAPTASDRDTCQCRNHENTHFMAKKLKSLKVIKTSNIEELVCDITCSTESLACMYRECTGCREKCITSMDVTPTDSLQVEWFAWKTVKEKRLIVHGKGKAEEKEVKITKKSSQQGSLAELIEEFNAQLKCFCKHLYNIRHQYQTYKHIKQTMGSNECLVHVDFAENYVGKATGEIQATHFGASKHQITLHTGVYYFGGEDLPHTFCSVSDSLQHGPAAIWTHLKPVLDEIQMTNPKIDTLHFFSDGPTTQYRQKGFFFLFTKNLES